MRRTTTLMMTIAALSLVVGLAACGGSSSDGEKKTTTTAAADGDKTTTTAGSDDEAVTTEAGDDTPTTVVATGGGEFCKELAAYMNDTSMADVDPSDPQAYKAAIEESSAKGRAMLAKAPDKLRGSVETLLDAQDEMLAALEAAGYDITKVSPDAFAVMDTPEVAEAGEKLDAYISDTCGIDVPEATVDTVPSN